ncbi:MAG: hypothetical protein FRX48_07538 [Lasallia pustulata]|uniref:Uncharacterized protein n=1 Tax=Lasallia pustulata TaxID=136370 RepID=A0A5M8PHX6_9LECA|nr:MAG: hypothetical protein FRX48_07538 [Lasallia pustulata]
MGITMFDRWASLYAKSMPLTCLKDSVIGIDAAYYLERLLMPSKEPLLSALGGSPFGLEFAIMKELSVLQAAGFKPHFVFNGLDYGIKDDPFGPSIASSLANAAAFDIYEKEMPDAAIRLFQESGSPTAAALSEFFKKVLYQRRIEFTVAPYSALAQLAYYEKHPSQFIDAVYGPSELFLYGIDKLITKFELAHEYTEKGNFMSTFRYVLEDSTFRWVDRRTCLAQFNEIPVEIFVDACLLAGSSILPTFPPLKNVTLYPKGYSFPDVVSMVVSCGRNITALCAQYQDDPHVKELDYLDRYRRALTGIKHHIIINKDGDIETLDKEHAPSDVHDCVGQRLPEELNMYLSRGMLRPRVLSWLTSGTIFVTAPCEGGDSREYQNLVKTQLEPFRRQALCLLSECLNRYYQRKEITTRFWFDTESNSRVNLRDLLPSPKEALNGWIVRDNLIAEQCQKLEMPTGSTLPGSLAYAVRSLSDATFASKTLISKPKTGFQPLVTLQEITVNAVWRFLQLRNYVDNKHELTPWGKVMDITLTACGSSKEQEEAGFIAVELLRLGLLNNSPMFPNYSGTPLRGTDTDKRSCLLVSRVASLGKLRHQPKGYSGPLSRHLLGYHSVISALRASLRDLVDISLATMFLDGNADRDRNDWMDLALGLPFYDENSYALGVVVKTYLDELFTRDDPTSETTRAEMKAKGPEWCQYCDFAGSLDDAFDLWDAVYKGVKTAGAEIKDQGMWDEVDRWLAARR